MINFQYDKLAAKKLRSMIYKFGTETDKALANAVNDTTKQLRTRVSAKMRETLNLNKRRTDASIQRIMVNKHQGMVRIKNSPNISLKHFKPKQTKAGVTYKPYKNRAAVLIPSAFGPKIIKLHGSVYVRNTASRHPISIKQYHSLAQDFRNQGIIAYVNKEASNLLRKNIKRRMNLLKLRLEGKVK